MGKGAGMFWVAVCLLIGAAQAISAENPGLYSGFLGCRFSQSLCQRDEECVNDHLFGSCQKLHQRKDLYRYQLEPKQLDLLQVEVARLVRNGNTWDNLYTQCVLWNILLAYRYRRDLDPVLCERRGPKLDNSALEERLTEDALRLLQKYFQEYYDEVSDRLREEEEAEDIVDVDDIPQIVDEDRLLDYDGGDDLTNYPPSKKDEYVQIHKYAKSHKRGPLDYSDYLDGLRDVDDYTALVASLKPEERALLKAYLQALLEEEEEAGEEFPVEGGEDGGGQDGERGYAWTDEDGGAGDTQADIFGDGDEEEKEIVDAPGDKEDADFWNMTPEDAQLISDLLKERRDVQSLTSEQVARLTRYVDEMLREIDVGDGDAQPGSSVSHKEHTIAEMLQSTEPQAHFSAQEVKRINDFDPADEITDDVSAADPHDHMRAGEISDNPVPTQTKYSLLDGNYCNILVNPRTDDISIAGDIVIALEKIMGLPENTFTDISVDNGHIDFRVTPNPLNINASTVAAQAKSHDEELKNKTGYGITSAGLGRTESQITITEETGPKYFVLTFVLCGVIAGIVLAVIAIYIIRRYSRSKEKLAQLSNNTGAQGDEASQDYQDLCRQRMQSKTSEKPEPIHVASRVGSVSTQEAAVRSPSSRSSTSSWSEEPVTSNMDISTGHIVLSYMEDHLKNKDRLDQEWENLEAYEADPNSTAVATDPSNTRKNRYSDILPYDHSRVVLSTSTNVSGSDYINASTLTDHDPRNPAYICTQGPLSQTVPDFWQMIWEQGSVVIVNLCKLTENGVAMCHRYWPVEGSDLYHIYEVHLVSEHTWCEDYLVRSFYLKNLQTNETRTVTQFNFLTWADLGVPSSAKSLLDFRRKVNKSYRGRSCPIVVHCSDGVGRTGTYCLIDMVLNHMSKGAKEIDIAATLEFLRDQRMRMVKTKEQFEFALASVAEEVHAILKALPQ